MADPVFMKHDMHVMASEPISMAYFKNLSHQSVCLYVYSLIVASQQFTKNVTVALNNHAATEELLNMLFSMWSMSYQGKSGNQFFPELLVFKYYLMFTV
jgi:hypothetical protein